MDTPASRLKLARETSGFKSAREAARHFGWEIPAYASHENGNRGIPPDAAITYSRAFGLTLDELYGVGSTYAGGGVWPRPHVASRIVPRLHWDFMGKHGSLETAMEKATEFTSLPKTLALDMPAFSMTVAGNSMSANQQTSFESGEEIILSVPAEIKPGDFVLAELFDENAVIFRQYRERSRDENGFMVYELAPLNTAYPTRIVSRPNQARIVAKMTHSIKSYS